VTKQTAALIRLAPAPIAIGLPVHNGEPYLRTALRALLDQTGVDFELWIGDNCSTDGTEEICREAARNDKRVRYRRRARNLGSTGNHNLLVRETANQYFTWAAADDAYEPDRLAKMHAALCEQQDAVLAFTWARQIDANGETVGAWHNPCRTGHPDPVVRLRDLIRLQHENYHCYGLYRRDVLSRTHLLPPVKNNDRILIAELALYGRFVEISEELLLHRLHDGRLTQSTSSRDWYRTQRTDTRRIVLPNVEEAGWYLRAVGSSPLGTRQRALALLALRPWLRANAVPMARNMVRAVVDGAGLAGRSLIGRPMGEPISSK